MTKHNMKKNPLLSAYQDIDEMVSHGASFEQKWYQSVIKVLIMIQNKHINPVESHKRLIEICDGLGWVQENLNENLNSQHRTLLKNIFSTNIQIINGAIETKNMQFLDIVISSLHTVMTPYETNLHPCRDMLDYSAIGGLTHQ